MDKLELTKDELVSLLKETTESVVKEQVDAQVKELGLDSLENKFARFSAGTSVDELNKLNGKEKTAQFLKALYRKDASTLANFKAMNETTGSAGGFLVPEEFTAEVYRVVEDFGLVSKMATKFPMGSDTRNVPTLASSVSGTYPGEATAGTGTQPVLAQVQLLAKTWIGLTPMSNELLEDANVQVVDLLVQLFAEAIAGEIDSQALAGSGSPFTGLLANASVTTVTMGTGMNTFASVTLADLRDLNTNQTLGFTRSRLCYAQNCLGNNPKVKNRRNKLWRFLWSFYKSSYRWRSTRISNSNSRISMGLSSLSFR